MAQRPIQVVHLVTCLNVGGLEMVVYNLARYADRNQFDIHVICLEEPGTLAPRVVALGAEVEGLGPPGLSRLRRLSRLTRRLYQLRPQILHTHNPMPHLFGSLAACLARIPVLVHTKHGRNYPEIPRRVALNRWASFLTTMVVAVSENSAEVARRVERVPVYKVTLIRNGIDLTEFPPPPRREKAGKRVIHVGRMDPVKDQHTLLRAARIVADAEPDFQLDFVGDGDIRAELVALHRELCLGDRVRFLGERSDIGPLLAAADLFVLSSTSEGLSLTLLEAMGSGLPIVATDVGGNSEVVVRGETGLLVSPQSPQTLAQAILILLRDPDRLLQMGRAGRRRVEKEFDIRRMVARYEALYMELLQRK
jgi:sugar transferase (PEP-CTERM/EpsH1 system associated)